MTEQNQQAAFIKEPNVTNQKNISNDNVENIKVIVENENLKENKNSNEITNDMNSNNDATSSIPSTGETVDIVIPPKKKKKKKKKKKSDAEDSLDFHDSGPREEDEDKLYDPYV